MKALMKHTVLKSCLTLVITSGVILSLLLIAGAAVMVVSSGAVWAP